MSRQTFLRFTTEFIALYVPTSSLPKPLSTVS